MKNPCYGMEDSLHGIHEELTPRDPNAQLIFGLVTKEDREEAELFQRAMDATTVEEKLHVLHDVWPFYDQRILRAVLK